MEIIVTMGFVLRSHCCDYFRCCSHFHEKVRQSFYDWRDIGTVCLWVC